MAKKPLQKKAADPLRYGRRFKEAKAKLHFLQPPGQGRRQGTVPAGSPRTGGRSKDVEAAQLTVQTETARSDPLQPAVRAARRKTEEATVTSLPWKTPLPVPSGGTRGQGQQRSPYLGGGPFHTAEAAARRLRSTPKKVVKQGREGGLLMVTTADGFPLFLVWQFHEREVSRGIAELLHVFRDVPIDRWMVVQWATTGNPRLEGLSAAQWLNGPDERDPEPALAEARSCAWRWHQ